MLPVCVLHLRVAVLRIRNMVHGAALRMLHATHEATMCAGPAN